jgi:hypothetical protein
VRAADGCGEWQPTQEALDALAAMTDDRDLWKRRLEQVGMLIGRYRFEEIFTPAQELHLMNLWRQVFGEAPLTREQLGIRKERWDA